MDEKTYTKEQVSAMMTNAMDGYDKGYDKGRARGKVDGIIQSLAGAALSWAAVKLYQSYCAKKVREATEAQNEEKETVDADFTEV